MPENVEFFCSDNNIDFVKIKGVENTLSQKEKTVTIRNFSSGLINIKTRYLKITAKILTYAPIGITEKEKLPGFLLMK